MYTCDLKFEYLEVLERQEPFSKCLAYINGSGNGKNVYEMTTMSKILEAWESLWNGFSALRPKFQEMFSGHSDSIQLALEEVLWQKE